MATLIRKSIVLWGLFCSEEGGVALAAILKVLLHDLKWCSFSLEPPLKSEIYTEEGRKKERGGEQMDEERAEGLRWKRRKEEEKFSLDQKTNNDSSYNRYKPTQLCQTQALHLKGRTEKKKEKKLSLNKRPTLLISGKVFTTNRLRSFICFWYQFPSVSPWLITVVRDI